MLCQSRGARKGCFRYSNYVRDKKITLGCGYERVVKSNSEKNRLKSVNFANSVWRLRKWLEKQKRLIADAGSRPAGAGFCGTFLISTK